MNKTQLKKDLTNNELAEIIITKIDEVREEADENVNRLARIMMEKFKKVDERFDKMDQKIAIWLLKQSIALENLLYLFQ